MRGPIEESPLAPWGVQLAGNFSKERALASYARARQRHAAILSDVAPMVIGTRMRSRGTRAFYRVRIPAATRAAAMRDLRPPAQGGRRVRGVEELSVSLPLPLREGRPRRRGGCAEARAKRFPHPARSLATLRRGARD